VRKGDDPMRKTTAIFIALGLMAIIAQQASAADKYTINVYDRNNQLAADVFINIWNGQDKIESGYTNSGGSYITWLDASTSYRITASKNDQYGEKVVTPGNSYTITINMN
jgi:hypothetical protein